MSLQRTAILLAVSHSNHHHSAKNTSASVWNSLASGSSSNSNASDFYTATNFNHSNKSFNNQGLRVMRPGAGGFHGNVNILLGGAMLTVVTTLVCLICYCCHRKIKMRSSTSSLYRQQRWLDNDLNMEIYSVEQYFDTSGLYSENDIMPAMTAHNEPPPSYECVIALDEVISRKRKNLYTFKGHHHQHAGGHERKDCMVNGENGIATPTPTTPQVSLDETNCDIRSPSSALSLCNCNCAINQSYAVSANLCANCNNAIDNMDSANNNGTYPVRTISGSNLAQDICCTLSDTNRSTAEFDSLNDQLNNNDYNGNSSHQLDSVTSPTPSTSTSTNYISCSAAALLGQSDGRQNLSEMQEEVEEEEDDDMIDGNGNCRQLDQNGLIRLDMSQIIDQTGLPTYEAALQLKSSGYV